MCNSDDKSRQAANEKVRELVEQFNPPWNAPIQAWPSKEVEELGQTVANEVFAKLPKVPSGYYIVPCPDPDSACIGWHCYMFGAWLINLDQGNDGFIPTGQHYCDGQSCITLAWVAGQLADRATDEDGAFLDMETGPLLINGKPALSFLE